MPNNEPSKRKAGRPPYIENEKDIATVRALVVAGVTQDIIAEVIGISESTLKRHYAKILATSRKEALARNTVALMTLANKGNAVAAIYLQKCLGGPEWRERPQMELTGTVKTETRKPDVSALSTDELKQIVALGKKCVSKG